MAQSRHDEAISVAENGSFPPQPAGLSRRNRSIIVDADFHGDSGDVWFVRRGRSGTPVDEFHRLEKVNGVWRSLGGGGGEPGADLESRPTLADVVAHNEKTHVERCAFSFEGGGSHGSRKDPSYRYFHCAREVAELRFSDVRPSKQLADHGYVVVMYQGKGPTITAFDLRGTRIGEHTLKPFSTHRMGPLTLIRARWFNQGKNRRMRGW